MYLKEEQILDIKTQGNGGINCSNASRDQGKPSIASILQKLEEVRKDSFLVPSRGNMAHQNVGFRLQAYRTLENKFLFC